MAQKRNVPKRSFTCPDPLWNRLKMAAAMRGVEENSSVSISELLRRGARREVAEVEGGEYEDPPELGGA